MSRLKRPNLLLVGTVGLFLIAWTWPTTTNERLELPLAMADGGAYTMTITESTPSAWLHVEVETKYAWIYQKSIGRAWTTLSRDDTTRVNVGELCLQLDCYGTHKLCETDTSYLELTEIKRRIAVKKKKAVVSAWANDPALERTTVEMMP